MNYEPINGKEILAAEKTLKNKLTSGFLIQHLTILFNLFLKTSVYPEAWETLNVCPLHKSQVRNEIRNYRPFSRLNNLAKILEIILYNSFHESAKRVILGCQHGFINCRFNISNLAVFSQHLCEKLGTRG